MDDKKEYRQFGKKKAKIHIKQKERTDKMIILITSGSTVHFPGLWVSELLPQGSFLLTILAEIVNEVWTVCQALG